MAPVRRRSQRYPGKLFWVPAVLAPADRESAEATPRSIEQDVAARAVTIGLVVGLNRNPLLDSLNLAIRKAAWRGC